MADNESDHMGERFCQCRNCAPFLTTRDIPDGSGYVETIRHGGQWISSSTYTRHMREEHIQRRLDCSDLDVIQQAISSKTLMEESGLREAGSMPVVSPPLVSPENLGDQRIDNALDDLLHIKRSLNQGILTFQNKDALVFFRDPRVAGSHQSSTAGQSTTVNSGQYALKPLESANAAILQYENQLMEQLVALEGFSDYGSPKIQEQRRELMDWVKRQRSRLYKLKKDEWERQRTEIVSFGFNTNKYFEQPYIRMNPVILACYVVVLVIHVLFQLPRKASGVLLAGIEAIVRLTVIFTKGRLDQEERRLLNQLPKDPRSIIEKFDLDPVTRSYRCCPSCYALYEPTSTPELCENRRTPESTPCGATMFRTRSIQGKEHTYPIRIYQHQEFKEWMARFLCRTGIEDLVDIPQTSSESNVVNDIWDANILRQFKGPDGKLFMYPPSGEGRYIFSFCVDGFNPFGSRQSKQAVSVTGIYLVCLNLPPNERYRPENMYLVGIIPGPGKPSTSEINPFIKALVDDLLPFWDPGVFFSRTAKFRAGRLVRCALIPLVSDAVAARQVAGFGSHNSKYFCTCCNLTLDDIENFDRTTWPKRDYAEHLAHAYNWKNAQNEEEQERLFAQFGIRWSELLRLPYWNPVLFTVVDSMHNLYLGLLKTHCRNIWGMNIKFEDGDGKESPKEKVPDVPTPNKLLAALQIMQLEGDVTVQLGKCERPVLWHLCKALDLRRAGSKKLLVRTLITWRGSIDPVRQPAKLLRLAALNTEYSSQITDVRVHGSAEEALSVKIASAERLLSNPRVRRSRMMGFNKDVLISLCHRRGIEVNSGDTKMVMASALVPQETVDGENVDEFPRTGRNKAVMGRRILTAVDEDIVRMELPSWVSPAPRGFGTTVRGKLSADQWRTACTINLPVTLIHLWGNGSDRETSMLRNFMDLITAVVVGSSLDSFDELTTIYEDSMLRYLTTLKSLYPEAKIVPNHHLALHLPDFFGGFGPTHAWRSFGFERYNYVLQGLNTNRKFGELEQTFMRSASRSANIRTLLQDSHIQITVEELVLAYGAMDEQNYRGTRLRDSLFFKQSKNLGRAVKMGREAPLEDKEYAALLIFLNEELAPGMQYLEAHSGQPVSNRILGKDAVLSSKIEINGVYFKSYHDSSKDSNVLYYPRHSSLPKAGRICRIFTHKRKAGVEFEEQVDETVLAIERLVDLSDGDARLDNYRKFPVVGGQLYYARFHPELEIIRPISIISHFGKTALGRECGTSEDCVHILPLNRIFKHLPLPTLGENDTEDDPSSEGEVDD